MATPSSQGSLLYELRFVNESIEKTQWIDTYWKFFSVYLVCWMREPKHECSWESPKDDKFVLKSFVRWSNFPEYFWSSGNYRF